MGKRRMNRGRKGGARQNVSGGVGNLDTKVITGFSMNPPPVPYVTPITKIVPSVQTGGTAYSIDCKMVLRSDAEAYGMPANTYRYSTFRVNWIKVWGPVGKAVFLQTARSNGTSNDYGVTAVDSAGYSTERPRAMLKFGLTDSLYVYNKGSPDDLIAIARAPVGGIPWVNGDYIAIQMLVTFLA